MRVNIIADSDGDYGMGHIVRQHRLAQVLRQRGADVHFWLDQESSPRGIALVAGGQDAVEEPEEGARYSDVIIVDRMDNDDKELVYMRQFCDKLVVFVGVGSTITQDTHWIADYVIWQSMEIYQDTPAIFSEKVRTGKDWLILSPSLRDAEPSFLDRREGIATYFGGGVNGLGLVPKPHISGKYALGGLAQTDWQDDIGEQLLKSRAFLGTMGMVAYEAISAGLRPLLVSRSKDHEQTALRLEIMGVAHNLGLYSDWDENTAMRAQVILGGYSGGVLEVKDYLRPDGWGAWRIAELILSGGMKKIKRNNRCRAYGHKYPVIGKDEYGNKRRGPVCSRCGKPHKRRAIKARLIVPDR